jgi:hypothetical protein
LTTNVTTFCGLSNFNVDGLYVPLLQNGGCILNTQPIAANDYCRINGLFWNPAKTIHNIGFSIAFGLSVDDTIHFLAQYRQD